MPLRGFDAYPLHPRAIQVHGYHISGKNGGLAVFNNTILSTLWTYGRISCGQRMGKMDYSSSYVYCMWVHIL